MFTGLLILIIIIVLLMLIGALFEPSGLIVMFNLKPTTFRLRKPKNESKYYLQIRILFIWYYIYPFHGDFNLSLSHDNYCLYYPNHIILTKHNIIMEDRYNIIKYFAKDNNPIDNINL